MAPVAELYIKIIKIKEFELTTSTLPAICWIRLIFVRAAFNAVRS